MLIAAGAGETKLILGAFVLFLGFIAIVVYLPAAIIREVTQSTNEELPDWMGSVRSRRARLRIVLFFLGIVVSGFICSFFLG